MILLCQGYGEQLKGSGNFVWDAIARTSFCFVCSLQGRKTELLFTARIHSYALLQFNAQPSRARGAFDCGRRAKLQMIPPSLLAISQGWGLIELPLRASNEGLLRPRVARAREINRLRPTFCSGSKESSSRPRAYPVRPWTPQARSFPLIPSQRGRPNCPLLRASDEHSFIARVLRARRTVGCPRLILCALPCRLEVGH